jgi:hypothetical protein
MKTVKHFLLLVLSSAPLLAHEMSHPVMVSRDDALRSPRVYVTVAETVRVLGVMVEFQQDNDIRTTGDGRFDRSAPTDPIIDAPPHDRQYFEDHFQFLSNYYAKVSKKRLTVLTTIIDSVFTLPGQMAAYSPPKEGPFTLVGDLARDAWQRADASGLVADFSRYNSFVVFHAGAGRDIDLVGTLGYDPTPLDIPSLYLGLAAFRGFYGQSYQGIPVNNGSFFITNSMILPEMESRPIPTVTGVNVLLELGINGLLCASFGNFLGLPDLFDTQTGSTAIGRFGLMDGQAIFSFAGLFPPEPSAWEKYWLGWLNPITLQSGMHAVSLPAVSLSDTVYRVPISAEEYYLVENRNRDPGRNGQTIVSRYDGIVSSRTFARDTTGFNAYDISALQGAVIDVEDLDFSLPGGVDQEGTFYDGGILIWHIDERIINRNLATNTVNADPDHRGVDLEEADGSQDIGQSYQGLFAAGQGSEEGTALDFWFDGNSSPVFKNQFSSTTYPSSASYSGALSHITISSFSMRGPRMTATVAVGDGQVTPLPGFPKSIGEQLSPVSLTVGPAGANGSPALFVSTTGVGLPSARPGEGVVSGAGKLFAWSSTGERAFEGGFVSGLAAVASPIYPPLPPSGFVGPASLADLNGDGTPEWWILAEGSEGGTAGALHVFTASGANPTDSLADTYFRLILPHVITSVPVVGDSLIVIGTADGMAYSIKLDGSVADSLQISSIVGDGVIGATKLPGNQSFVLTSGAGKIVVTEGGTARQVVQRDLGHPIVGPAAVGSLGSSGDVVIAAATSDGLLYLLNTHLDILPGFPVDTRSAAGRTEDSSAVTRSDIISPPALADVNRDGVRDVIVFSRDRICVYNSSGASLDNFPVPTRSGAYLSSAPAVADVDGDGLVDVVGVTTYGLVLALNQRGEMAAGFPLQAGSGTQTVAAFSLTSESGNETDLGLSVASSDDGSVSAWRTGTVRGPLAAATFAWPQYQKDAQHTGLATEAIDGTPVSSEFFPATRAYNWPNPVYDGRTYLRYFVKDNATVQIKIFDLAGDLVTEFSAPGIGGVDNEVAWDVRDVQSGVYFARIEASTAGQNGVAIVKVAVVK